MAPGLRLAGLGNAMNTIWAAFFTLAVGGAVLARFIDLPDHLGLVLSLTAMAVIIVELTRAFALLHEANKFSADDSGSYGRLHIVAHVVPLAYLVVHHFGHVGAMVNLAFLVPFLLFYYTGRRLWQALFARFALKHYRMFVLGNTGLMVALTVTGILALFIPGRVGSGAYTGAVLGYFSVHFLITGFVMLRLGKDVRREQRGSAAEQPSST